MVSNNNILICTDLDRTLIPNGDQPESPLARPLFRQLLERPEIRLAYVSGRDRQLMEDAIAEYAIPTPDYAITDVGTTIYQFSNNTWTKWQSWYDEISRDWGTYTQLTLAELLQDIKQLQLQEERKQGKYKLSYYADEQTDIDDLFNEINTRFHDRNIRANLIWSIDETTHTGLLDVLPQAANKLHAIRFLMQEKNFSEKRTVFAGDSGNDLEVLCSDLQAVLVANATPAIKQQASELANNNASTSQLYTARGSFLNMNGNYAAGILEGVAHYLPETLDWMEPKS